MSTETPTKQATDSATKETSNKLVDRMMYAGFILGLIAISFQAGVFAAIYEVPPVNYFKDATRALSALSKQRELMSQEWPTALWSATERTEKGLVHYTADRSQAGYTVYTSGHDAAAVLLDHQGQEVHRWTAPFSQVWPKPKHVRGWTPDEFIYMRRVHVYPNGDLLALYETPMDTPNGYGLARLDRDSKVIWTYDANAHHDLFVADNENIYVLTHLLRKIPGYEVIGPVIEDQIAILSPDGKELKTISILPLLFKSPYFRPDLLRMDDIGDLLHVNTIERVDAEFASHHETVSAGDLLICMRNLSLLAIINPEKQAIVWAATGPWNHPHDPDALANGRIMIFDNYLARGAPHGSAVLEFDPTQRKIDWMYAGSPQSPFRSDIRACQQVMANGNVLITESDNGRIFEVTRDGNVVWEYINPVRGGDDNKLIPIVCGAARYSPEQLPFVQAGGSTSVVSQTATTEKEEG